MKQKAKTQYQVLLVDDHPLINDGLASCLKETGRCSRIEKAGSLEEARRIIRTSSSLPSIIILDILLGKENGLDLLPFLEDFCLSGNIPKPPVLICSVIEDPFRIQSALKMGASGYLPKTGGRKELLDAISTVLEGKIYLKTEHSVKLHESDRVYAQLTKREMEVLNLIKQDRTNQHIAKALGINIRTVENHISNIYFKTGVRSRGELHIL